MLSVSIVWALFLGGACVVQASFPKLGLYEPETLVTDHANIDKDLQVIDVLTSTFSEATFNQAQNVYEKGGYSKSVATVNVVGGAPAMDQDAPVNGITSDGSVVLLKVYSEVAEGASTVDLQYLTTEQGGTTCNVGGLVEPDVSGCLVESGTFTVEGVASPVQYTYTALNSTFNGRTLQGFSTTWPDRMIDVQEQEQYVHFKMFTDFYGSNTYADDWVTAAFQGSTAQLSNFASDFGSYDLEARAEIITKGIAYMVVAMYVIRELEDAIDDCQAGCDGPTCNDDRVEALDEAVAFYVGSLGTEGGEGQLFYTLAQKRCANFKTCGRDGDSTDAANDAKVNFDINEQFEMMKSTLRASDCDSAYASKDRIAQLMTIPLIQGTLRYAYITGVQEGGTEKAEAEGAAFAAAVLPWINSCSEESATTIATNMKVGQGNTADFAAVKKAFEQTYKCLEITCAEVGGLIDDTTGDYYADSQPCNTSGSNAVTAVSLLAGVVTTALVALLM